jgi:ETFB lysine methyltransferase
MTGSLLTPATAPALRLRYSTLEIGNYDIHVRALRDRQQFLDRDQVAETLGVSPASWSLFGVIWDSSIVLANHMLDFDIAGKRILEVGCGLGLTSLLLSQRMGDITATDYNPEAGKFLLENIKLNCGRDIPFVRTGWADISAELGHFDVIIGSDLLYEPDQVTLLAGFIEQHANPTCSIVLVDPGRGLHARFSKLLVSLGYSHSQHKPSEVVGLSQPFRGQVLHYSR